MGISVLGATQAKVTELEPVDVNSPFFEPTQTTYAKPVYGSCFSLYGSAGVHARSYKLNKSFYVQNILTYTDPSGKNLTVDYTTTYNRRLLQPFDEDNFLFIGIDETKDPNSVVIALFHVDWETCTISINSNIVEYQSGFTKSQGSTYAYHPRIFQAYKKTRFAIFSGSPLDNTYWDRSTISVFDVDSANGTLTLFNQFNGTSDIFPASTYDAWNPPVVIDDTYLAIIATASESLGAIAIFNYVTGTLARVISAGKIAGVLELFNKSGDQVVPIITDKNEFYFTTSHAASIHSSGIWCKVDWINGEISATKRMPIEIYPSYVCELSDKYFGGIIGEPINDASSHKTYKYCIGIFDYNLELVKMIEFSIWGHPGTTGAFYKLIADGDDVLISLSYTDSSPIRFKGALK